MADDKESHNTTIEGGGGGEAMRKRKKVVASAENFDATNWTQRVEALAKEVAETKDRNNISEKRALHSKVELARMDMCEEEVVEAYLDELLHETDASKKKELMDTPLGKKLTPLLAKFDELRKALELKVDKAPRLVTLVRMVACFFYLLIWLPVFASCSMLRPLHPLLRKLGIPERYFPLDIVIRTYCNVTLLMAGIELKIQGLENQHDDKPSIVLYSHVSNLDPIIVAAAPGPSQSWIAKKDLFKIPIIGWVMWGIGHISIDRNNLAAAIASIRKAENVLNRSKRSIAISPEGTRSKTGQLMEFKKGPFHLVKDVGAPITPILAQGAYEIYPPGQLFTNSGVVVMRYLPQVIVDKNESVNKILSRVRRIMLKEMAKDFFEEGKVRRTVTTTTTILSFITTTIMLTIVFGPPLWWLFG